MVELMLSQLHDVLERKRFKATAESAVGHCTANVYLTSFRDPWLMNAMIDEGIAGDDLADQGLHTIVVFGNGLHQVIHHDLVIAFELAAEGIGVLTVFTAVSWILGDRTLNDLRRR